MPSLVLGPLLRYVGENEAVLWVETDSACEVEILGSRERTFCVCDHHYALVCCGDLAPGTWHEYEVMLDGERVWPQDDGFPASGCLCRRCCAWAGRWRKPFTRPMGRASSTATSSPPTSRSAPTAW